MAARFRACLGVPVDKDTDTMTITPDSVASTGALGLDLEREARLFAARHGEIAVAPSRSWLVADLEYAYDRPAHECYLTAEGKGAETSIRWPFHRVAAVSWMVLRFAPGERVPIVEGPIVHAADATDEREMVAALFAALDAEPEAVLTTWGGEAKDLAILRRCAATHGLVLPLQLREGSPHARERLDLCRASCVQASPVHLPEMAAAVSVPSKPSPSTEIGQLVERGAWREVREQVAADVLTTAVLAVRHLRAHGQIECDAADTMMAMAAAARKALPASAFVTRTFAPWARGQKAASGLRGVIFRADPEPVRPPVRVLASAGGRR